MTPRTLCRVSAKRRATGPAQTRKPQPRRTPRQRAAKFAKVFAIVGVVGALFEHYCRHPEEIPDSIPDGELATRVTDYLAGMTDRYCIRAYTELQVPQAFAR